MGCGTRRTRFRSASQRPRATSPNWSTRTKKDSEAAKFVPSSLKGKTVHEVGCGIAPLPALTTAAMGAEYSVATDFLPGIVDFAQSNVDHNVQNIAALDGKVE